MNFRHVSSIHYMMWWYILTYISASYMDVLWTSYVPSMIMFVTSTIIDSPIQPLAIGNLVGSLLLGILVDSSLPIRETSLWGHFIAIPYLYAIFFIQSVLFYVFHRLLHTRWLYGRIHSMHHQYVTDGWWTAFYCHPIEMILVLITFHIPKLLTFFYLMPRSVLLTWNITSSLYFMHTHGKREYPLRFPLRNHWLHHHQLSCNYSSEWIDRLFGTYIE